MMKAYWMVHVDVGEPEKYDEYRRLNAAAFRKYGGRFLARGGRSEVMSGPARPRHVIIEFPDYDAALACYRSPEYQAARARAGSSQFDSVIVEGYDGPQPAEA